MELVSIKKTDWYYHKHNRADVRQCNILTQCLCNDVGFEVESISSNINFPSFHNNHEHFYEKAIIMILLLIVGYYFNYLYAFINGFFKGFTII